MRAGESAVKVGEYVVDGAVCVSESGVYCVAASAVYLVVYVCGLRECSGGLVEVYVSYCVVEGEGKVYGSADALVRDDSAYAYGIYGYCHSVSLQTPWVLLTARCRIRLNLVFPPSLSALSSVGTLLVAMFSLLSA